MSFVDSCNVPVGQAQLSVRSPADNPTSIHRRRDSGGGSTRHNAIRPDVRPADPAHSCSQFVNSHCRHRHQRRNGEKFPESRVVCNPIQYADHISLRETYLAITVIGEANAVVETKSASVQATAYPIRVQSSHFTNTKSPADQMTAFHPERGRFQSRTTA